MKTKNPPAPTQPSEPSPLQRPWQATALGVIDVLMAIGLAIGAIFSIFSFRFFANVSETIVSSSNDTAEAGGFLNSFLTGFGIIAGIFLLLGCVLYIFLARGMFKGQTWSPILSLFFAAIGVLGQLLALMSTQKFRSAFSIALYLFVVYLAWLSIKHPFFRRRS